MRIRNSKIGDKNIVGERIRKRRQELDMKQTELLCELQIRGVDLTASGLSKIEGQTRSVCDFELLAIADVLSCSVMWLLGQDEDA